MTERFIEDLYEEKSNKLGIPKTILKMIDHSIENFDKVVPITKRTNKEQLKKIFDKFGIKDDIYVF